MSGWVLGTDTPRPRQGADPTARVRLRSDERCQARGHVRRVHAVLRRPPQADVLGAHQALPVLHRHIMPMGDFFASLAILAVMVNFIVTATTDKNVKSAPNAAIVLWVLRIMPLLNTVFRITYFTLPHVDGLPCGLLWCSVCYPSHHRRCLLLDS